MADFIFCTMCGMTEQRVVDDMFATYWYCKRCGRLCDQQFKDDGDEAEKKNQPDDQ